MGAEQERHRPGSLKQQNKAHKHGKHRSKGAIDNARKGRAGPKEITKKARHELKRQERRHQASQIRQKKRDEVLFKKRSLGTAHAPPFLVAIIPLCREIDPFALLQVLKKADEDAIISNSQEGNIHIRVPRFKQRFTFLVPPKGDLYSILDALKVADTVLFLVSAATSGGMDTEGEVILTACMAQGLPATIVTAVQLQDIPPKKRHDAKQQIQKVVSRWLPDVKVTSLEKESDGLTMLRRVGEQKQKCIIFRDRRPHLLAESSAFIPDETGPLGTFKVSGYVRGCPLSVNSLVHIPGWGDFQMHKMTTTDDPYPLGRPVKERTGADAEMDEGVDDERLLAVADPELQESLVSENVPDPMEGEQTWPTEEELREVEEESKARKLVKKVPKGISEYQAAWIPDCDAEEISGSEEEETEEDPNAMEAESESEFETASEGEEEQELDSVTVSEFGGDAQRYDEKMDLNEEQEALQKMKDARAEQLFPDEVDTPQDTPARIRFQKYRGLQSFRTSPWDPKENLPMDYARIFQFENFDRTRKKVLKDSQENEGALPGWYVTLYISKVPCSFVEKRRDYEPLVIYGLLPHEQKMSVLNMVLKRPNMIRTVQEPIKSKEPLIFHCGFRRFKASPIFSQHTNGTKHKYERYFQPDATVVATVFAPIVFPPCTTIVFKEKKDGTQELVAVGSVLSANPDRIVAKRVVLSGHPFKVHKRSSVIRFMFFNREDIEWFKPVELKTKYGRRGHIKEPLGTHGHMKCVFDGQLKSQDTVLLCLYKRVFPKWTYESCVDPAAYLYNNVGHIQEMEEEQEQ